MSWPEVINMTKKYDVIIVGGGPAGIFAALEIVKVSDASVLLIEKGRDIDGRQCPARERDDRVLPVNRAILYVVLVGLGPSVTVS